jgi:hypothetical protein
MTDIVAIRTSCPLEVLTTYHDADKHGLPECRQGETAGTSYTTIPQSELPEDIEKCRYCTGDYAGAKTCSNPNSLAYRLEQTAPEEVTR